MDDKNAVTVAPYLCAMRTMLVICDQFSVDIDVKFDIYINKTNDNANVVQ